LRAARGLAEGAAAGRSADGAREDVEVLAHAAPDVLLHGRVEHFEVPGEGELELGAERDGAGRGVGGGEDLDLETVEEGEVLHGDGLAHGAAVHADLLLDAHEEAVFFPIHNQHVRDVDAGVVLDARAVAALRGEVPVAHVVCVAPGGGEGAEGVRVRGPRTGRPEGARRGGGDVDGGGVGRGREGEGERGNKRGDQRGDAWFAGGPRARHGRALVYTRARAACSRLANRIVAKIWISWIRKSAAKRGKARQSAAKRDSPHAARRARPNVLRVAGVGRTARAHGAAERAR